jgi:hypothetical protein
MTANSSYTSRDLAGPCRKCHLPFGDTEMRVIADGCGPYHCGCYNDEQDGNAEIASLRARIGFQDEQIASFSDMELRETMIQKSLVEARQDLASAYQVARWFAAYLFGGRRRGDFYEAMGRKLLFVLENAGTPWPNNRDADEYGWRREVDNFCDRADAEASVATRL